VFCFSNCKQNHINNPSQNIGIQLNEIDFLYEKIENDITVFTNGIDCESLFLNVENAQTQGGNCHYKIKPNGSEPIEIRIFKLESPNDTILLKSKKYLVKSLPKPLLEVGGKNTGEMSLRAFKPQQGIYATNIAYYLVGCFNIEIEEFKAIAMRDNSVIKVLKNKGGRFNDEFEELKQSDWRINSFKYNEDNTR